MGHIISRALTFKLNSIEPVSDGEREIIEGSTVTSLHKVLLWRRSVFHVALLPLLLCAILEWVLWAQEYRPSAGFIVVRLDSLILLLMCVAGSFTWKTLSFQSTTALRLIWLLVLSMSVCPLLFQDFSMVPAKQYFVIVYSAVTALMTIPFCLQRASIRLFLLETSLFHWTATLLCVLPCLSTAVTIACLTQVKRPLVELAPLLATAIVFIFISPWTYVVNRHAFFPKPNSAAIDYGEIIFLGLNIFGAFLAVCWALTVVPISHMETFQLIFDVIGRTLLTNVICTDALVRVSIDHWSLLKETAETIVLSAHAEEVLQSFRVCMLDAETSGESGEATGAGDTEPVEESEKAIEEDIEEGKGSTDSEKEEGHEVFKLDLESTTKDLEGGYTEGHEVFKLDLESSDDDDDSEGTRT